MKVAMIVRKLNTRGGVQRHVLYVARELKKAGHEVVLYTFLYSKEDCFADLLEGMDVRSLDFFPTYKHRSAWSIVNIFRSFGQMFRENDASKELADLIDKDTDILNPHDHVCYRVAYYFKERSKNVPSVWVMHDMPTKQFMMLRAQKLDSQLRVSLVKRAFYRVYDAYDAHKFIKAQNEIAVLDERDKKWAKKYFGKNATIIRNGVDANYFSYQERIPPTKETVSLFMNGIFFPHRRFEDGISALGLLVQRGYNATLTISGSTKSNEKYYASLVSLVARLGLQKRVRFTGEISEEDFLAEYHKHHLFLFPNHMQSWGLAVFEAMSCGMPVIVSDTAGASEVLTDKENAVLFSAKDVGALAKSIEILVSDSQLYNPLRKNGRSFVEKKLSWAQTADALIRLFVKASV